MKKKIRGNLLLLAAWVLGAATLTGCGPGAEGLKTEETAKAMGRYLEADVSLPENMQWVYDIQQLEDGSLYMSAMDADSGYAVWKLEDNDTSWEKVYDIPAAEMHDGDYGPLQIYNIALSPQGEALVLGNMPNPKDKTGEDYLQKCYYLDMSGDMSGTMTDVPYEPESGSYHPMCTDYGSFYLDGSDFSVRRLNMETGKSEVVLDSEIETYSYGTAGKTMYSVTREGDVTTYDMEAQNLLPQDEGLNEAIKQSGIVTSSFSTATLPLLFDGGADENTMFFCGSSGLFRHTKNGSVTEKVIDGAITSLSNPDLGLVDMEIVTDGDAETETVYILTLSDSNDQYSMMKYVYSADTSTVPNEEIRVCAIRDNADLRQAISLYQKENPDVYITLDIALQDEESVTVSDALRTVATEIMAGSGADLLLLDGMPLDSYMEKGLLEDISDILQEADESGGLFTNITSCFTQEDGKTYAVPLRFNIPVVEGQKESLDKIKDLKTLADEAERLHSINPKYPVVSKNLDGYTMAGLLYDSSSGGWLREDGTVDEAQLQDFYTQLQRLFSLDERSSEENDYKRDEQYYRSVAVGALQMYCRKSNINFGCITDFADLSELATTEADMDNIRYDIFGGQGEKTYLPSCIAGISSKGKNTEGARDFLEYLLSKNAQMTDQGSGMPVSRSGTETLLKSEGLAGNTFGTGTAGDSETYFEMTLKKLSDEAYQSYLEKVETLEKPALTNAIIREAVLEQAAACTAGTVSAEEAVQHVVEKVNLYLAEG